MTASALTKFTQGASVASGQALKGTVGTAVTVENVDNTDVASWQIDLLYVDPASGLSATTIAYDDDDNTPSGSFLPDVTGCYRLAVKVWSSINRPGDPDSVDYRIFVVPEANGLIVPPPQLWPEPLPHPSSGLDGAKPNEFNLGGQEAGWSGNGASDGFLGQLIRLVDAWKGVLVLSGSPPTSLNLQGLELTNFYSKKAALDGSEDVSVAADSNPHLIGTYVFSGTAGDVISIGLRVYCASTAAYTGKHMYENTVYIQLDAATPQIIGDPLASELSANPLTGMALSYSISGTDTLQIYATSSATACKAAAEFWVQPSRTINNP